MTADARLITDDDGAASDCYRKKRYPDEAYARKVARRCFDERGALLRAYPCTRCGGYHLTRQEKRRRA